MAIHRRLQELAKKKTTFPSLSIIVPLVRIESEKTQNLIRFKDALHAADKSLLALKTKEAEVVHAKLHAAAQEIDVATYSIDGLALLIDAQNQELFELQGPCKAEVVLGNLFALSSVIAGFQQNLSFWALVLHKDFARLFFVNSYGRFEEIITPPADAQGNPLQGFPLNALPPSDKVQQAVGKGDRGDIYLTAEMERFFRLVDNELQKVYHAREKLPLLVCATPEELTLFQKVTHHGTDIIGTLPHDYSNHDHSKRLRDDLLQVVQEYDIHREALLLGQFTEAANIRHQACGITSVWEMIAAGRVRCLLFDSTVQAVGRIDPENRQHIQIFPEPTDVHVDRIIDIFVYETLKQGGDVRAVKTGSLASCDGVGALLRY